MTQTVDEKVALITGAGSGIGRALAQMLAEAGWRVALMGRRESALSETAQLIEQITGSSDLALLCPGDVTSDEDAASAVEAVRDRWGRLDALVSNAGRSFLEPIDRTEPETIRAAFEVNAIGPAVLTLMCWPLLEEAGEGRIVYVSMKGTVEPFKGFFAYAASKCANNMMAQNAALEGRRKNIKAFAVAPGGTETGALRSIFSEKVLPTEACLTPVEAAGVMYDCLAGDRDGDNGKTILVKKDKSGEMSVKVVN